MEKEKVIPLPPSWKREVVRAHLASLLSRDGTTVEEGDPLHDSEGEEDLVWEGDVAVYIPRPPLYVKVRFRPKDFRILRVGEDGFHFGLGGLEQVPYRWHEAVLRAGMGDVVLGVESEKDADTLHRLGFPCFSWCGAQNAKMLGREEVGKSFWNAKIVLLPHNDSEGLASADEAVIALRPHTRRVAILRPERLGCKPSDEGKDITDWVEARRKAGWTYVAIVSELHSLILPLATALNKIPEYPEEVEAYE